MVLPAYSQDIRLLQNKTWRIRADIAVYSIYPTLTILNHVTLQHRRALGSSLVAVV